MKRYYIKLMVAAGLLSTLFSCKEYLDVRPDDKILEDQAFSTPHGVNAALNGLYISLAKQGLYGGNLTLSTVDILAQRYNLSAQHGLYKIATYAYTERPAVERIDSIWTNAYGTILNANLFVEKLEKYKGAVSSETESIYKGEALAIRAMLHFDLLRLYGPMYNSADSTKASIPYYSKTETKIKELLPANKVMDLICADLSQAASLLEKDPIITQGVMSTLQGDGADFMRNRNYRLNYYAVKALQARVNMYRGNKVAALAAAKVLIDNADKFAWVTTSNALEEKANPDRVFSTEMIMGVFSSQLYSNYLNTFSPDLPDAAILAPLSARLQNVFESNENDFRYNLNWSIPTNGGKSFRVFYKYADIVDKTKNFRFTIPLMKISEMYYIAAECEPDIDQAFAYLNTVRGNRGLTSLETSVSLTTELQKEYQKEFFGEGQLFYYYKRKNMTAIPAGNQISGNQTMGAATYVLPLPLSEIQYR
ncbi:hypothetical protein C3K47_04170 [Solitalea longa]|uniref:Uncharacterized protein n=1 Tax=Solitalea longa TaxID=2079460 RepID=A0A2S5A7M5_9SPHI|nr:RagB/SusD family nutrient uptake outer membrane protein [Solitalea longa]POY38598.1 hypothetical protein C3K47_04170 [Solitalea longa]